MSRAYEWCRARMTKENMIVLALSGVLLMVAAIPADGGKKEPSQEAALSDVSEDGERQEEESAAGGLERRLEQFLSCMDVAGKVKVMIPYSPRRCRWWKRMCPRAAFPRRVRTTGQAVQGAR